MILHGAVLKGRPSLFEMKWITHLFALGQTCIGLSQHLACYDKLQGT